MALCDITFWGERLQRENVMEVWLPSRHEHPGPYPTLYMLHEGGSDQTTYLLKTRLQQYAEELPLIIVMPNGERGYCVDAPAGPAHEQHLVEDVVGFVERFLPTIPAREARALGGQSMGGYAAMKLALKYPRMFGSVCAQAGSYRRGSRLGSTDWPQEIVSDYWRLFGPGPEGGPDDIFGLAEQLDPAEAPEIRFESGLDDSLLQHARDLADHFARLNIDHKYVEYPGVHDFDTWDRHLRDGLDFLWQTLGSALEG
jgi:enterochelin esterase-like enzyme